MVVQTRSLQLCARRRERLRSCIQVAGVLALIGLTAASAVIVKTNQTGEFPALAAVGDRSDLPSSTLLVTETSDYSFQEPIVDPLGETELEPEVLASDEGTFPAGTKWFDGRPVRAAKTIWMTVTAYTPGEESCGASADGITSSLHSVETNGMKLVAADSKVLPLGSMVSIPGYSRDAIVPVLDRGGKIKGNRLDVLFATPEQARAWGVKRLKVVVWEYADGKPASDWRKIRDSKR